MVLGGRSRRLLPAVIHWFGPLSQEVAFEIPPPLALASRDVSPTEVPVTYACVSSRVWLVVVCALEAWGR